MTPPPPPAVLLNESQRRRLGITLGQIQQQLHEIGSLVRTPAPRGGLVTEADDLPAGFLRAAPELIGRLDQDIATLAARFDLPRREKSRFRWVRAVLGIGIDDLEDTRAASLRGYGTVHPELAAALDPGLTELQEQLRTLLALLEGRAIT